MYAVSPCTTGSSPACSKQLRNVPLPLARFWSASRGIAHTGEAIRTAENTTRKADLKYGRMMEEPGVKDVASSPLRSPDSYIPVQHNARHDLELDNGERNTCIQSAWNLS